MVRSGVLQASSPLSARLVSTPLPLPPAGHDVHSPPASMSSSLPLSTARASRELSSLHLSPSSRMTAFQRHDSRRTSTRIGASKRSPSAADVPAVISDGKGSADDDEEEEVELSWLEEKVEDLGQYTASVVRAVPGPRVGDGDLPWLLALPLGYAAISLAFAVVKTVRRYTSSKGKRRRQIGKNAWLVETLSEYLPAKRDGLTTKRLTQTAKRCQFDVEEVLRKYIRYALNERPFDPELVTDLIHLRKVSLLDGKTVAEVLCEVSRRVVKAKGPVIVDTRGFTERGLKRKVAVQALFSKILYLAELDEFCSPADRNSLGIKEIFGVTDEDANHIRIETLSGETEVESLEDLIGSASDEDTDEKEL